VLGDQVLDVDIRMKGYISDVMIRSILPIQQGLYVR